jgi:outer membrane lipoprotein-sorting protein
MRKSIACWMTVLSLAGCASAQNAPPLINPAGAPAASTQPTAPVGDLTQDSSIDEILDALKARGDNLKTFSAQVALESIDPGLGSSSTQRGTVLYDNSRAGQNARIRVIFDDVVEEGKIRKEKHEYLLDGEWLTERTNREKSQIRRQVLAPGEKMNLLKLGEGPFPLPIGQPKEEVQKQFEVQKIVPSKDDPPGTVHIRLTPKPDTRFAKQFKKIDVWVDQKTHFTNRIDVIDPNGISAKSTKLTDIKVNAPLKDDDFKLEPINEKEWKLIEEPYQE